MVFKPSFSSLFFDLRFDKVSLDETLLPLWWRVGDNELLLFIKCKGKPRDNQSFSINEQRAVALKLLT